MMDIFWRRVCRPISEVRKPSIIILPSGSASRNKAEIRELLPAPVRPTMPTYRGKMSKLFLYTCKNSTKRQNIIMLLQTINHSGAYYWSVMSRRYHVISQTTKEQLVSHGEEKKETFYHENILQQADTTNHLFMFLLVCIIKKKKLHHHHMTGRFCQKIYDL